MFVASFFGYGLNDVFKLYFSCVKQVVKVDGIYF